MYRPRVETHQQQRDIRRELRNPIRPRRLGRLAMASEVHGNGAELWHKGRQLQRPVEAAAAEPVSSNNGGPLPASS